MKKISIFLLVIMGFSFVSCDQDFEKINEDPNNPTKVPAHLLIANTIKLNQDVLYGLTASTNEMGWSWTQQISLVDYNEIEKYEPRRSSIDAIWNNIYVGVLAETKEMEKLAIAENNTNLQGIALVLRANAFELLTDAFGPIPFTEALDQTITQPKYDSEQVVHAGIISLLTQADALFASNSGVVPASSDLVYGGNTAKWRKLANALKLKALMRISKNQAVGADVAALVAAGNLMTSNADSGELAYLGTQPDANPIYETIVFSNRPEYKVSSVLVNKLVASSDPRLAVYAQKNASNAYVGNTPGTKPASGSAFSAIGTEFLKATLPGVIMSYAQQQLLLAEAANEGYIVGGLPQAELYYQSGITASMNTYGLTPSPAYLASPSVKFITQAGARPMIGEQMWLALFGQGFEAWSEWRRTGFPVLTPLANGAQTTIPKRFYYQSQEVSLNKSNYNAASATLNNGDLMTSKLWWQ